MKTLAYFLLAVSILVTVYLFEGFLLRKAESTSLDSGYFFSDRFSFAELDWNGPDVQGCVFEYHFLIYGYQTCFVKSYENVRNSDGSFTFVTDENGQKIPSAFTYVYTSPSRKLRLSFGGVSGTKQNHLRFKLPVFSAATVTIHRDGEISQNIINLTR